MTRLEALALGGALPAGLAIGLADTRSEEVQGPALLLFIAAALLASRAPRLAIPIGLLTGLGVPLVHGYVRLAHVPLPFPMNSYWGSFVALIPATIGALAGAGLSRLRRGGTA
ncbi:MAG TPA: hypothetical protein VGG84_09970 [Gemmatimonadaceae bacterium]|jgi:hypothetical protein